MNQAPSQGMSYLKDPSISTFRRLKETETEDGEVASLTVCFKFRLLPDSDPYSDNPSALSTLIREAGGIPCDYDGDDYAMKIIDIWSLMKTPHPDFAVPNDTYSSSFIYHSIRDHKKGSALPDPKKYLITPSVYSSYDPMELLMKNVKWSDLDALEGPKYYSSKTLMKKLKGNNTRPPEEQQQDGQQSSPNRGQKRNDNNTVQNQSVDANNALAESIHPSKGETSSKSDKAKNDEDSESKKGRDGKRSNEKSLVNPDLSPAKSDHSSSSNVIPPNRERKRNDNTIPNQSDDANNASTKSIDPSKGGTRSASDKAENGYEDLESKKGRNGKRSNEESLASPDISPAKSDHSSSSNVIPPNRGLKRNAIPNQSDDANNASAKSINPSKAGTSSTSDKAKNGYEDSDVREEIPQPSTPPTRRNGTKRILISDSDDDDDDRETFDRPATAQKVRLESSPKNKYSITIKKPRLVPKALAGPSTKSSGKKKSSGNRVPITGDEWVNCGTPEPAVEIEDLSFDNDNHSEASSISYHSETESAHSSKRTHSRRTTRRRSPGRGVGKRLPYSKEEDKLIIRKLCDQNAILYTRGRRVWELMANSDGFRDKRTWQSLENRFRRHILPGDILKPDDQTVMREFDMSELQLKRFKQMQNITHNHDKLCPEFHF